MWQLISTKEKRKYRIIESLYKADKLLKINELAELIDASARIIKYDLPEIKESLKKISGDILSSADGIFLQLPASIGLDYFQRQLYHQSNSFLLLEKIFFEEDLGFSEMMAYLYISDSSLRRLIKNIQLALQEYGIQLETNPFRISGDEALIRNFYTAYFSEKYTLDDWPFENVDRDIIHQLLTLGRKNYEIPGVAMRYHHYHFFFGVELSRGLNGYSLSPTHQLSDHFRESMFQVFSKSTTSSNKIHPIVESSLRQYFNEFVDWGIFISVPYLQVRMEQDNDLKQKIQHLKLNIHALRMLFDLPETDLHYLILQIHNVLETYRLFPPGETVKKYLLFPPFNIGYKELVKQKIPLFYQEAEQMFIRICNNRGVILQKDDFDFLLYLLLSWWDNLTFDFLKKFNSCRILVASHLSLNHAKTITANLQSELSSHYTFDILPGNHLTKEKLAKRQFDLLIVTKSTTLEIEQPILYMDGIAMRERFSLLRQMTEDVVEKNKQAYLAKVKSRMPQISLDSQ